MQDNALGVVKHNHVDNSVAGEVHVVEVRVQGEVIAERTYALRQSELCPRERFTIGGQGVDRLKGSGFVCLAATRLQKDGESG